MRVSRVLIPSCLWLAFTPFITYLPVFQTEYQPFFVLLCILFFVWLFSFSAIGLTGSVNLLGGRLLQGLVFFTLVSALVFPVTDQTNVWFRYLSFIVGCWFFSRREVIDLAASKSGILLVLICVYALVAGLQLLGKLPANLPLTNRSNATLDDLIDSGRGIPSLATEPSTYADVIVAIAVFHYLSAWYLAARPSVFLLLSSAFSLLVLSRSTVYFVLMAIALLMSLAPLFWKRFLSTACVVAVLVLFVAYVLPLIQPRTYELLMVLFDAGSDLEGVLKAVSLVGEKSFSYRATNIFGVPTYLFFDLFGGAQGSCYNFLFLDFSCAPDASSLTGFYINGGPLGKVLGVAFYAMLLVAYLLIAFRVEARVLWLSALCLVAILHVSGNSPFFPMYFVLFSMIYQKSKMASPNPLAI
jgi:hypothetical protein